MLKPYFVRTAVKIISGFQWQPRLGSPTGQVCLQGSAWEGGPLTWMRIWSDVLTYLEQWGTPPGSSVSGTSLSPPYSSSSLTLNILDLSLQGAQTGHAFSQAPKENEDRLRGNKEHDALSPSDGIWQQGWGILTLPVDGKEVLLDELDKKDPVSPSHPSLERKWAGFLSPYHELESSSGWSLRESFAS